MYCSKAEGGSCWWCQKVNYFDQTSSLTVSQLLELYQTLIAAWFKQILLLLLQLFLEVFRLQVFELLLKQDGDMGDGDCCLVLFVCGAVAEAQSVLFYGTVCGHRGGS